MTTPSFPSPPPALSPDALLERFPHVGAIQPVVVVVQRPYQSDPELVTGVVCANEEEATSTARLARSKGLRVWGCLPSPSPTTPPASGTAEWEGIADIVAEILPRAIVTLVATTILEEAMRMTQHTETCRRGLEHVPSDARTAGWHASADLLRQGDEEAGDSRRFAEDLLAALEGKEEAPPQGSEGKSP